MNSSSVKIRPHAILSFVLHALSHKAAAPAGRFCRLYRKAIRLVWRRRHTLCLTRLDRVNAICVRRPLTTNTSDHRQKPSRDRRQIHTINILRTALMLSDAWLTRICLINPMTHVVTSQSTYRRRKHECFRRRQFLLLTCSCFGRTVLKTSAKKLRHFTGVKYAPEIAGFARFWWLSEFATEEVDVDVCGRWNDR